ncbi:metalloregulator ArsR/SmtB family transcription factor [Leifsonia sp. YIM 134122]|uniref:Metalloregulator ArsR/SmtB family transcription factor n=1 Tax=Leifsonia stereocauli TaxID=3134136 RepID=A0ABU9W4N4_9MICO
MSDVQASAPTAALRLLADPTRAKIITLILNSEDGRATVTKLAEQLDLSQPTLSHHAKALTDDGILQRNPVGRQVWYSVDPDRVDEVSEALRTPAESHLDADVLGRISADLAQRFAGTFGAETVERYVHESYALLAERANITRYLTSLTSKFTADRLSALARAQARPVGEIPEVLFVCVQNAGRSQIASAILRHLAGDKVSVRTAGSEPAAVVRSVVTTALDEIGVSLDGEYPKPLTDEVVRAADVVITMGCGDACPIYPGRRYLDWELDDPAGLPLPQVRRIRDEIEVHVRELLTTL